MTHTEDKKGLSTPAMMLRLEGLAVLLLAVFAYSRLEFSWLVFFLLLLWPDIAIVAYAINKDLGTAVYNLLHTYTMPIIFIAVSIVFSWTFGIQFALIWFAHIGMDRLVGYGLKYRSEFKDTHITRL